MAQTHISAEMKQAIGTVTSRRVSFPVSESDIRKWAIAVYYPEPAPARFIDADVAARTRFGGIVAPEEFNAFAWATAASEKFGAEVALDPNDPTRTEKELGIAAPDVHFMVNGGLTVEYGAPIRPGDTLTATTRLADYRERSGRLGLMLFTTTEETVTNQDDEVVKRSRMTLIRY